MELWLVATDQIGAGETEVALDVDHATTLDEVANALGERIGVEPPCGLYNQRLRRLMDLSGSVADEDLRFGDSVIVAPVWWIPPSADERRGLSLSVIGGPAAGSRIPLQDGRYDVGRGEPSHIVIDDSTMSRSHFRITVSGEQCEVSDNQSSNGTFVNGRRISGPEVLPVGALIECGHSLVRLDRVDAAPPAATTPPRDKGLIRFNRPPRMHRPAPERVFKLPAVPSRPTKGRIPMISALGPLLIGLPIVILAQDPTLRIIGLVSCIGSPILALLSYSEDRRGGKGKFAADRTSFYRTLADTTEMMATSLVEEMDERRQLCPDPVELIRRVEQLAPSLWERRSTYADFLTLSAGRADQSSLATYEIPDGGDETIRMEANHELSMWKTARNVPVVVDLQQAGVVGLSGPHDEVTSMARWFVLQLSITHSPRDLVLAVAVSDGEASDWGWVSWLPHLRSETSPLSANHLAVGDSEAAAMFDALSGIIRTRRADNSNRLAANVKPLPAIVVVVSELLRVPRTALTSILEDGSGASVHVVWLGTNPQALPGECGAVLEVIDSPPSFTVSLPNVGSRLERAVVDSVSPEIALATARRMASIKDVTAGGVRGQIPRSVHLAELLGLTSISPAVVVDRWARADRSVSAVVGVSAAGPFVLDMRLDGPHALVGGTTGAGKSELLQTFVAALALSHPPNRVTFLLVDYKGGAAFKDAVALPHTVGYVTDLDGHLVARVLISLNAELHRRERLLRDHGAKDLLEMERRLPQLAPPSLLLIVDEFATLAKELPEFVDGVVNVAQRGRSLGIHLILATQRPAGIINDNIRANTNLRIALRVNDATDSDDVIGSKDAAALPRTLPGRAFARTGEAELTEVQVAYVGGNSMTATSATMARVEVLDLLYGRVLRRKAEVSADDTATDLQTLVSCMTAAVDEAAIPIPDQPWLPPLEPLIPLAALAAGGRDQATLGVIDLPHRQAQEPWVWNLEDDGSMVIYGTSGSGKTSLLRTIAASLATSHEPAELNIYGLDFATRGLSSLEHLPHVGSVVPGDDVERVQRLIQKLEREIRRRKDLFASVGASLLSEYRNSNPPEPLPRIVVLLDGYSGFTNVFDKIDFGEWIEKLPVVVGEGRPLGIHFVITGDRRTAVGLTLAGSITKRIVLRMADDDDYASLGLDGRTAKSTVLPPGRGFVDATVEFQAAVVGDAAGGDAQASALEALGMELQQRHPTAAVAKIGNLPTVIFRSALPRPDPLSALVGVGQSDLGPLMVDLESGNLLVAGPNRSGRSTLLSTLALSLAASTPDVQLYLMAPRRSPLTDLAIWIDVARGPDQCDELGRDLQDRLIERDGSELPIVVIVDDGTELADSAADSALEKIIRRGRDTAMFVIGAVETTSALRCYGGWIPEIRKDRRAFLLNPDADIDGDLVSVRLPRRAGGGMPAGRGYLVTDGVIQLAQVAS